jgi:hypothetical protein
MTHAPPSKNPGQKPQCDQDKFIDQDFATIAFLDKQQLGAGGTHFGRA